MRKMKDSGIEWIGEIPGDWTITKLKYEISGYKAGPFGSALITEKLLSEGDILVYTPENVALYSDETPKNMYLPEERRREMSQFFVTPGDIIFPIVGSLGRSMKITSAMKEGIINQRLAKFRINSELVSEDYFMWLFSKSTFYDVFIDLYRRGSIILNLTKTIVNEMPIPIPGLNEQRVICDFLDCKCSEIDALRADIEKEIATLEEYKKSVITEAVTKGLDPNVEMKESGIEWVGEIPAHWNIDKGKYCLRYVQKPTRPDDEVITCFRDGEVTLRKNRREEGFTISLQEIGYQGIDVGDLIVHGMDGFAGSIGISDSRGKASPVLNVLDTENNKRYVMYYLRNMAYGGVFLALATGIRVRTCDTNWGKLRELPYILPPRYEQDQIVDFIDATLAKSDEIIADKRKQLVKLDEYKKSLIYEYVTGKKEV